MIELSQLTAVDWVIIVVLTLSVLLSLWRGFVREAISLAGWVAAFLVANLFVAEFASVLLQWIDNITGSYIVAYVVLFVGTLIFAGILARLSAQVVRISGLSLFDRLLGTVFGFTRGIIIILVTVYVVRHLIPPQDLQWLHHSQLMPYVDMLVQWVQLLFHEVRAGTATAVSA